MKNGLKKVFSIIMVALLLATNVPMATFAVTNAGITMVTVSTDTASAELLDRTPGSVIGLTLLPAVGNAVLSGNTVNMTALESNTAYVLTVTEAVTTVAQHEYDVERRWVSATNSYYYYFTDNLMIEHEAVLAQIYYKIGSTEIPAINLSMGWAIIDYFIKGSFTTVSNTSANISFETLPSLTVNVVGSGTVVASSPPPYVKGSTVTLTATPAAQSHLVSWSDSASLSLTHDVLMDDNKIITATFATNQYDVNFVNLGSIVHTTPVAYGSTVAPYSVDPREGFVFDGWYNGDLKYDFATPITNALTLTARWIPVNLYFTVDNEIEVYHNGSLITPVYTPTGGTQPWQLIKHYSVALHTGDVIAVKGTDVGGVAGFIGEIRINGVAYPTQADSFWRSSVLLQSDWNTKNFMMDASWKNVINQDADAWAGQPLIGTPSDFDATWVWSENNTYDQTQSHITYFRYVVGGFPTVTFDSNGGNIITPITIPAGTTLTGNNIALPVPVKAGFDFTKWVLFETTTTFNALTVVDQNLKVIALYTPKEVPTTNPPTVTPDPPLQTTPVGPQGIVIISFVDTEGVSISQSAQFNGEIGTNYGTVPRTITGYTLVDTPANASGSFINGTVTVTYVYTDGTVIIDEETPQGEGTTESTTGLPTVEATTEVVEVETEEVPLAEGLPQTGQLPVELFYGAGSLIAAIGVFLKRIK